MLFNVPQFINIEDKIVGPFTAKQIGWLALGGVLLLVLWNMLNFGAFLVGATIVGGAVGALAFYRPFGQPMTNFVFSSFHFLFRPKVYVWKRNYDNIGKLKKKPAPVKKEEPKKKRLNEEKIEAISVLLDENRSIGGEQKKQPADIDTKKTADTHPVHISFTKKMK